MPEPLRGIGPLSPIDLLEEIVFYGVVKLVFKNYPRIYVRLRYQTYMFGLFFFLNGKILTPMDFP